MTIIENKNITSPLTLGGDGIQCFGKDSPHFIRDCVVDFSACHPNDLDENFSTIGGANVTVSDCTFSGGTKLALCGNGDYPEEDAKNGKVRFDDCIFQDGGRRFPEAQDGVKVILYRCTIKNWGIKDRFDVRAFGVWAHHGAEIYCRECRFEQTSFFQTGFLNFLRDLANHIGQAWNDRGLWALFDWKTYLFGVCRGLIATDGGKVKAIDCTKNKWWIYIENNEKV